MDKTYILQKDLPNAKAGDKFIWQEVFSRIDAYYCNGKEFGISYWLKEYVENNSKWFVEYIPKTYSEDDMRKCFEVAKESSYYKLPPKPSTHATVYNTFEDYLKTL